MKRPLIILAAVLTALSVRAEQKNVQLLTNMSDLELQRTMNMMRASLGVNCDFCHVVDEKTGWQFDKDDKKEKKTTREMIGMVLKINKEQFNGRVEVSCWTCHRGSIHPASLVSLPTPVPPFPTPKPSRPELPTLDEVVKKYATALGNVARLQKPRKLSGLREAFDGKPVSLYVDESGARWRVRVDLPTGTVEQVVTESGGWSRDAKGIHDLPASSVEQFRELAAMTTPPLPSSIPPDARVVGKETILRNMDTIIVAFRTPDGVRHRLNFNTATGLLARVTTIKETPIGSIPQQTDFEQWQDLKGTTFPMKVTTSLVDPWLGSTRQYKDVVLDATIDETEFSKPK
jgi:photosynthetic reaction center cytochrome c subunit